MDEDVPYNNDQFYAINGDQAHQFEFNNTHSLREGKGGKRPQSANIRITKDKGSKNKNSNRNVNYPAIWNTDDDGGATSTAPEMRGTMGTSGKFREPLLTNPSQFNKSPSKIQK